VDARLIKEADTQKLEKEISSAGKALSSTRKNKSSLEAELDSLSADVPHYERKRRDMMGRLDALYDKIEEQEELLDALLLRKKNIEENAIRKETVFDFLNDFKGLYGQMTDEEKKRFYKLLIEKIEVYREPLGNGQVIKSISFKFPLFAGGDCLSMEVDVPALSIKPMRPATYPQIKAYVKEHYGVQVHTCYIAEVKRKCGLDMRKNYNTAKKNAPKKPCPKEKEQYIREALEYFGMVKVGEK